MVRGGQGGRISGGVDEGGRSKRDRAIIGRRRLVQRRWAIGDASTPCALVKRGKVAIDTARSN